MNQTISKRPRVACMAMALWVAVGALLAYGISQTVIKASALFG